MTPTYTSATHFFHQFSFLFTHTPANICPISHLCNYAYIRGNVRGNVREGNVRDPYPQLFHHPNLKQCSSTNPIPIPHPASTSLPVSTLNTIHHSRMTVRMPASLSPS